MNRRRFMLWFHWTTVLLVTLSFVIAWGRAQTHDPVVRAFWLDVHRTVGFAVLALTLARLAGRLVVGAVSNGADLPLHFRIASRCTHVLLYLGLVAMPLLGWAQSSARAHHFKMFGLAMPALTGHDADLADTLGWWHKQGGWALLAVIGAHALAALYHHYIRRDDVLRQMLPSRRGMLRAPHGSNSGTAAMVLDN